MNIVAANTFRTAGFSGQQKLFPVILFVLLSSVSFFVQAQSTGKPTADNLETRSRLKEVQLTFGSEGHFLNSTQCFSKDDHWIVYDTRNDETGISANQKIARVNTRSGAIKTIYQTTRQTAFGPGVGAATFSPVENRVLFIHGIRNANEKNPYSATRRTGVSVNLNKPAEPEFLDARNIIPPFSPGALRGGTHAHTWAGDGNWISFTYNDFIIEQLARKDTTLKDIRMVAVMNNRSSVTVPDTNGMENNNGKWFAAVVTKVTDHPAWGSDEIDRAFDESWIGSAGYIKNDGTRQKRAIAFQGNVKDSQGKTKTEIFIVDLPDDITRAIPGCPLEGTATSRPCPPAGVHQHRITFSDKGIQGPRFWLRTTEDGQWIGFLAADKKGVIQLFLVSPDGHKNRQLTFNDHSIEGPFNFSPNGSRVAYIADNSIYITRLDDGLTERMTPRFADPEKPVGAVVWNNRGNTLTYNRYRKDRSGRSYLQIFLLPL